MFVNTAPSHHTENPPIPQPARQGIPTERHRRLEEFTETATLVDLHQPAEFSIHGLSLRHHVRAQGDAGPPPELGGHSVINVLKN